jgi:hypothetical protein
MHHQLIKIFPIFSSSPAAASYQKRTHPSRKFQNSAKRCTALQDAKKLFFHHRLQPLVTSKRPNYPKNPDFQGHHTQGRNAPPTTNKGPNCSRDPDLQGHHSQGRNAPLGTTSRHRTTTLTRATAAQQGYIRIQFSSQLQSTTRGPRQPVAQSFEKCNCVCPVLNTDLKPTVLIGKSFMYHVS